MMIMHVFSVHGTYRRHEQTYSHCATQSKTIRDCKLERSRLRQRQRRSYHHIFSAARTINSPFISIKRIRERWAKFLFVSSSRLFIEFTANCDQFYNETKNCDLFQLDGRVRVCDERVDDCEKVNAK